MRLELTIDGMVAVHAKHAVFAALAGVLGVERAEVELGRAELVAGRGDQDIAALEHELREAIAAAGFVLRAVKRLPPALPMLQ